ncbi:MAG: hypothetical protein K6E77_10655 [Lachnospiraceae bacterium]|jgi:hypothetical protein|nr:hypothetical protein [Lachnospiraceae bacterium]MCR5391200.1 hypothetical protein [Lachnospiraceae bacterium]
MINESRIKLMTRLAAYESSEGKKNMSIGTYFRGDYISGQIMKSIIYGTVAFALVFVLYLLYDAEKLMESIYEIDLMGFGKELLIRYLVFIGIYSVITYIVYAVRHRRARRKLRIYYNNLRRLDSMYRKEGKG